MHVAAQVHAVRFTIALSIRSSRRAYPVRPCLERVGSPRPVRRLPAHQVATGLEYLHSRDPPIVHRDIKSHNVLLLNSGTGVKICDFGLVPSTVRCAPALHHRTR